MEREPRPYDRENDQEHEYPPALSPHDPYSRRKNDLEQSRQQQRYASDDNLTF